MAAVGLGKAGSSKWLESAGTGYFCVSVGKVCSAVGATSECAGWSVYVVSVVSEALLVVGGCSEQVVWCSAGV